MADSLAVQLAPYQNNGLVTARNLDLNRGMSIGVGDAIGYTLTHTAPATYYTASSIR